MKHLVATAISCSRSSAFFGRKKIKIWKSVDFQQTFLVNYLTFDNSVDLYLIMNESLVFHITTLCNCMKQKLRPVIQSLFHDFIMIKFNFRFQGKRRDLLDC